jgi:hypothetical protein
MVGRIPKSDERYNLLLRVPRNDNGRVSFRKKRTHHCAYTLCALELGDDLVVVLYKLNPETTDEAGNKCASVSFDEYVR